MSAVYEESLGATKPYISDIASQYVTADKPETTAAFTTILKINLNFSTASQTSTPHTCKYTVTLKPDVMGH